jgi:DNA-binding NarL/FixJ family response regulator
VSDQLRVVLVDDHPVFREGLRAVLAAAAGCCLVAEAGSVAEAVAAIEEHRPDVVLMDLQLPDGSGIEATSTVLALQPQLAVVVLTMSADPAALAAALAAGSRGYLLKGASPREVVAAVEAAAAGQAVLDPGLAQRLVAPAGSPRGPFASLAERERDVLGLVASGASNDAIASALFLSPKTVRNYVSTLLTKTGCTTRPELIVRAREAGYGGT